MYSIAIAVSFLLRSILKRKAQRQGKRNRALGIKGQVLPRYVLAVSSPSGSGSSANIIMFPNKGRLLPRATCNVGELLGFRGTESATFRLGYPPMCALRQRKREHFFETYSLYVYSTCIRFRTGVRTLLEGRGRRR